jgi:O-antigen/teichoic acid export membrane protein
VIDRLPKARSDAQWSTTLSAVVAVGVLGGMAGAGVTVLVLAGGSSDLRVIGDSPWHVALLALGIVFTTLLTLLQFVFVAQRRAEFSIVLNGVVGGLRVLTLAGLLVAGLSGTYVVFGLWAVATIAATAGALALLLPRAGRAWRPSPRGVGAELRRALPSMLGHHVTSVAGPLLVFVLPVLVTLRLSAVDNAYFYVTWMLGSLLFVVASSVGNSLFAEASHDPAQLREGVRRSIRAIAVALAPLCLGLILLGRFALSLFGSQYADRGFGLLLLLVASVVPDALTVLAVTYLRVKQQVWGAAVVNVVIAAVTAGMAYALLPQLGIDAVGWAFMAGQCAGAVAFVALRLLRRVIA